jgi:hypothetical protein
LTTFVASDGSTRTVTVLIDGPETVETVRAAVELQPEPEPEPKEPPAVDDPP